MRSARSQQRSPHPNDGHVRLRSATPRPALACRRAGCWPASRRPRPASPTATPKPRGPAADPTRSTAAVVPSSLGRADGACSLMQGGLGLFQFDGGTYAQTLARDGEAILTVAGNVQRAVGFVTDMVVRSTFVSGVDTDAQAIAWMNEVRIGNSRWDAWISTVTRYYNGCRPTSGCWSGRYASYRDKTAAVHDEMGASFWNSVSGGEWVASYVNQTFPLAHDPVDLTAGEPLAGHIEMRNDGSETWRPGEVYIGHNRAAGWRQPHRGARLAHRQPPRHGRPRGPTRCDRPLCLHGPRTRRARRLRPVLRLCARGHHMVLSTRRECPSRFG